MKVLTPAVVVVMFCVTGCATTPLPAPRPVETWPESVANTCPKLESPLCCFRSPAIRFAMRGLAETFRACFQPGDEAVEFKLNVHTSAGSPACVAVSRPNNETARCVANVVARRFVIPNSPDYERCSFRYPLRFQY